MDSGNSGSMQSSSGGDEEYDSRPDSSLPAFLNSSSHFGSVSSSNPQASLLHHHQQQPTMFDPSQSLFHAFSQSPQNPNLNPSLLNLNVVRPQGMRSDPSPSYTNLQGSASSQPVMGVQGSGQGLVSSRSAHDNGVQGHQGGGVGKNPKKRTRASRRAPTTVLTTDTSNFRAMVQEFTGIPAPPFSGSPYARRLDLFGTGSGMRASHLESMVSLYPLRSSAQKVHQPSPFVSTSSPFLGNSVVGAAHISSSTSNNNNSVPITPTNTSFNTGSISHQLPSDLGLPKHPQNMINMQTQMLSLQSLLQPPLINVPSLGSKSQANLPLPTLDEDQLGMNHGGHINVNLSGLPSQVTTEGLRMRSFEGDNGAYDRSQDHLRSSFDGNFGNSSQHVNSTCKLNYSASSSEFHHEKGLENVPSRGKGTVDSWICPSE